MKEIKKIIIFALLFNFIGCNNISNTNVNSKDINSNILQNKKPLIKPIESLEKIKSLRFWYESFSKSDTRGIELDSKKLKYLRYNNSISYETVKNIEIQDLIVKINQESKKEEKYFYDEISLNNNSIFQDIISELNIEELNKIAVIVPNIIDYGCQTCSDGTDNWIEIKYLDEKNQEKYLNLNTAGSKTNEEYNKFLTKISKFSEKAGFIYSKVQEIDQITWGDYLKGGSKYKRSFDDKLTPDEVKNIQEEYIKNYPTTKT